MRVQWFKGPFRLRASSRDTAAEGGVVRRRRAIIYANCMKISQHKWRTMTLTMWCLSLPHLLHNWHLAVVKKILAMVNPEENVFVVHAGAPTQVRKWGEG
jgi:hypothetical protein